MTDPALCASRRRPRRCTIARPVAHAVVSRLGSRGAFDACALRAHDAGDGVRAPRGCVAALLVGGPLVLRAASPRANVGAGCRSSAAIVRRAESDAELAAFVHAAGRSSGAAA